MTASREIQLTGTRITLIKEVDQESETTKAVWPLEDPVRHARLILPEERAKVSGSTADRMRSVAA